MIYLLVNNDYQLQMFLRHDVSPRNDNEGISLIAVPHSLSSNIKPNYFKTVFEFASPLGSSSLFVVILKYHIIARKITKLLKVKKFDTLIFYTEYEWINQIIVQHFRKQGASVIMIEDGGLATYIPMSTKSSEPLDIKCKIIELLFRTLPGLGKSSLFKLNGNLFPRLSDSLINKILLYRDITLFRNIPTYTINKPLLKSCNLILNSVVFLNEMLYEHYQSTDSYFLGLKNLINALCNGFEIVYFKFHPRESIEWKKSIKHFLEINFPKVKIIDTERTFEEIVTFYRPEVLASYFSASLLNIEYEKIQPLFLYHLLDDLKDQPVFQATSNVLKLLGYNFVTKFTDIRTGYQSSITDVDTQQFKELDCYL